MSAIDKALQALIKMNDSVRDNSYILDPIKMINSGDDLNDYTEFGTYISQNKSVSETLLNTPITTGGFTLRVMRGTSGGSYKVQEIVSSGGQRLFRSLQGGTFGEWMINMVCRNITFPFSIPIQKRWSNASPTSAFNPQKINLTIPDGSRVLVCFRYSTELKKNTQPVLAINAGEVSIIGGVGDDGVNSNARSRSFNVDSTGITFYNCYSKNTSNWTTSTVSNTYCIPAEIYVLYES